MNLLIKNGKIFDVKDKMIKKMDIKIENGLITKMSQNVDVKDCKILDVNEKYVLPGLVDIHTHFREPGFEYKETIKTGSMAAAAGGFTTVCVMPNTKPVIDDKQSLGLLKSIIEKDSIINILPVGAVTKGQKGKELNDIEELYREGIYAISDDGQPIMNTELMEIATVKANELEIPILIHSEDKDYINGGCINQGKVSKELNVKGIPRESENEMIKRDIEMARRLGLKIHLCHISTKESVKMIREAKKDGVKVTCEVTPHHFTITDEAIKDKKSIAKVNPPLREKEDVEAIIKGIKDGTIDVIATDHAPHSEEEKKMDLYRAPFGLSGIELSLPLTYTNLVERGVIDMFEMIKLMSTKPCEIMGIKGGTLRENTRADITIFDSSEEFTVSKEELVSKGKNTPFIGERLLGRVIFTIVNGEIVYRR